MGDPSALPLRLVTLGAGPRLIASTPEGEVVVIGPGKPLGVLVYLALQPSRSASRAHLSDLLWADADLDHARQSLRYVTWQLRRKLGDTALVGEGDYLTLGVGLSTDYHDVATALQHGRYAAAVDLYRGDFLEAFGVPGGAAFEHWADRMRDRLRSGWLRALDLLAREDLAAGRYREACGYARRLRDANPEEESGWRLLLEALLRSGDAVGSAVEAEALESLAARTNRVLERRTREIVEAARSIPLRATHEALAAELVGRQEQFRRLADAWDAARAGSGRHCHVSAPSGLGKTRLLSDARHRLGAVGGRVISLRAPPGTRSIPYGLAASLVRELSDLPGALGVAESVAAAILALDPTLSSRFRGVPDPAVGSEALRRRMLALVDLVGAISEETPLALLLDDVHWADPDSLRVILGLVSRVGGSRVLVVTAARPFPEGRELEAAAEVLSLPPLSEDEVEAMVSSLGALPEAPWSAQLVRRLYEAGSGSPLLALETLQLGMDRGALRLETGEWRCLDPGFLAGPAPAGDALRRRIDSLDPAAGRVLAALAVAGTPLAGEVLEEALELDGAEAERLLASMEVSGFVAAAEGRWRLGHDQLQDVVLERLGSEAVPALAGRLGRVIARGPRSTLLDLRRAAAFLVESGDRLELEALWRRWVRLSRSLRDRRPDDELARGLVGATADDAVVRRLLAARPLYRRLGLITRGRWVAAAAGAVTVAAVAGALRFTGSTAPAKLVVYQAPLASGPILVPTPVIEVQDRSGRRAVAPPVTVRVELVDDTIPLIGNTVATTVNGLATFEGVDLGTWPRPGRPTLRFSAEGLGAVTVPLMTGDSIGLWLESATLDGQTLDSVRRSVEIAPGQRLTGELVLRYSAIWGASAVILAAVPTWGDRADATNITAVPTPAYRARLVTRLDIPGPTRVGTYRLILAFAAEPDAKWIASLTNWAVGAPRWNDGNDLADRPAAELDRANREGRLWIDRYVEQSGRLGGQLLALTTLMVKVAERSTSPSR